MKQDVLTASSRLSDFGQTYVPQPADPSGRVELLDALRGFALFGVCLSNLFSAFSYWDAAAARALPKITFPTDGAAHYLMEALIEGKFYSIFSLLFGIGFALQLHRAESRGADALPLFGRRIRILMVIGLTHLLLLWMGDILLFYALMALVLIRMRHMSDRRLLRWAAACILIPIPLYLPVMISQLLTMAVPFFLGVFGLSKAYGIEMTKIGDAFYAFFTSGHLLDWAKLTTLGAVGRYADLLFTARPFKVLAMFLVGMVIGRRQIWASLDAYVPQLKRVTVWGFVVGLPASLAWAAMKDGDAYFAGSLHGLAETTLYAFAVAPLALAYAACFALLWRVGWDRALRVFAPAGKMALTNYLSQSLVALIIYSGFGFRFAGRVGPTVLWAEAIATLALQIAISKWWLSRYRFGPMEWVWRSLTYRSRQPFKLVSR